MFIQNVDQQPEIQMAFVCFVHFLDITKKMYNTIAIIHVSHIGETYVSNMVIGIAVGIN